MFVAKSMCKTKAPLGAACLFSQIYVAPTGLYAICLHGALQTFGPYGAAIVIIGNICSTYCQLASQYLHADPLLLDTTASFVRR